MKRVQGEKKSSQNRDYQFFSELFILFSIELFVEN